MYKADFGCNHGFGVTVHTHDLDLHRGSRNFRGRDRVREASVFPPSVFGCAANSQMFVTSAVVKIRHFVYLDSLHRTLWVIVSAYCER